MVDIDFRKKVDEYLKNKCGVAHDDVLLVALSGGADSVALLQVLLNLGYKCGAAHCNFHLRGEESLRDERFVRELCYRLGVALVVHDFDVDAYRRGRGLSVEMACRELRYEWFMRLLDSGNFDVVAVAHHQDDNIETMFLNMLRGTGMNGLKGMRPRNGRVVRPLLCVNRQQVEDYLEDMGQEYVTDSTNGQNVYLRNKVRNVILPTIDNTFPDGRKRITQTMGYLEEYHLAMEDMCRRFWQSQRGGDFEGRREYRLDELLQMDHPKLVLYHLLLDYGFNVRQSAQILEAAMNGKSQGKSHFYSSTHALTIRGKVIVVERIINLLETQIKVNLHAPDNLPVKLELLRYDAPLNAAELDGKNVVAYDESLMNCKRMILRRWRRGDRMCPYGMGGRSRLVSDIFNDAHYTLQQKRHAWLLEADGVVVWILGLRASHDYRVLPHAASYLKVTFRPLKPDAL